MISSLWAKNLISKDCKQITDAETKKGGVRRWTQKSICQGSCNAKLHVNVAGASVRMQSGAEITHCLLSVTASGAHLGATDACVHCWPYESPQDGRNPADPVLPGMYIITTLMLRNLVYIFVVICFFA